MACGGGEEEAQAEGDEGEEEGEEDGEEEDDDELTEEEHKKSIKKIIEPVGEKKIEIDESLFNLEDLAEIRDELDDLEI